MRNSLVQAIVDNAKTNENIVIVTGDLGYNVLDKFSDIYPNRFFNAGIAEENMTSVAAGMAIEGKCVFTYSIGNFSSIRCLEQIRNDVCYHNANVKIVSLAAGFAYGSLGMSHHATEDIACMRSMPNLTVFSPSDPLETTAVTNAAIKINGPCFIRLARGGEKNLRPEFNSESFVVGKAYELVSYGNDVAIFSTGSITTEAVKAAELLKNENIKASIFTFPTIKPIDEALIRKCANEFKLIVTVEEHQITGGFGGAVAEVLSEIPDKHAPLIRVGLRDVFTSVVGDTEYLRSIYKLDAKSIVEKIKDNCGLLL